MAKKRKSIATSMDEVDRTMYASFCSAANSLSQLYTQAMNHQKFSFQAGERHGLVRATLLSFILIYPSDFDCVWCVFAMRLSFSRVFCAEKYIYVFLLSSGFGFSRLYFTYDVDCLTLINGILHLFDLHFFSFPGVLVVVG